MADLVHRLDTSSVVITVRLPRFFGLRMWIVLQLIQLAGSIAPVTIEAEIADG